MKEQVFHAPMVPGAVDDPSWRSDCLKPEDAERKAELDQVLDPAESMKAHPDTKNLTLGQIKARDEDNLRLVLGTAREYRFSSMPQALYEIGQFLARAMRKLGVSALYDHGQKVGLPPSYDKATTRLPGNLYMVDHTPVDEARVTQQLVKNNVRVEIRHPEQYDDQADKWKSGMYIYHNGEIAYFISNPLRIMNRSAAGGRIVLPSATPEGFYVKTNAPHM